VGAFRGVGASAGRSLEEGICVRLRGRGEGRRTGGRGLSGEDIFGEGGDQSGDMRRGSLVRQPERGAAAGTPQQLGKEAQGEDALGEGALGKDVLGDREIGPWVDTCAWSVKTTINTLETLMK